MPDSAEPTLGFHTRQLHAGRGESADHRPRSTPIQVTAGFVFDDFDDAHARFALTEPGFIYTRHGNPTAQAVERRIAALEGGTDALLLSSGNAATVTALLAFLRTGDRMVSSGSIYEGTRGLFLDQFAGFGIEVDFVFDTGDLEAWRRAITPGTRAVFLESIPNPKNDIHDLPAIAALAHEVGAVVVVDNTLATPYLFRPFEHGADLVVHSASKFLGGHGGALGGVIVDGGRFDWADGRFPFLSEVTGADGRTHLERGGDRGFTGYLRDVVLARYGGVPSPFNAFLIEQGMETLALRMQRHVDNSAAVAAYLATRPEVLSVDYAGLPSTPSHETARALFEHGYGSVFSFTIDGGQDAARTFYDAVRLFTRMTHLGDVRSLILHPATTTHVGSTPEQRDEAGIWPGLLRVSVGIEDADDLIADLDQAFAALR